MGAIRVATGFFRLWIVLSVLWIIGTVVVTYQIADNVPTRDLTAAPSDFDDLLPAYSHCWDYRTKDGRRIDRKDISKELLLLVARCQQESDKKDAYLIGASTAVGVPIGFLLIGLVIAWIIRGLVPRTA